MKILRNIATPVGSVPAIHSSHARETFVPVNATLGVGTGSTGSFGGNIVSVKSANQRQTVVSTTQPRISQKSNLRPFNSANKNPPNRT